MSALIYRGNIYFQATVCNTYKKMRLPERGDNEHVNASGTDAPNGIVADCTDGGDGKHGSEIGNDAPHRPAVHGTEIAADGTAGSLSKVHYTKSKYPA